MARLKRVFDIDISLCPRCGGKLRVIGEVTEPAVVARLLAHLKARERQCDARRRRGRSRAEPLPEISKTSTRVDSPSRSSKR